MRLKSLSRLKALSIRHRLIQPFVETERLFPAHSIRDYRRGSTLAQFFTQLLAIVCLVAERVFEGFDSAEQPLRDRAVVSFTPSQQDSEKAAFSIRECVDLRVAPSSRTANRLLFLPPFPPEAERCALI
jgi:hypothetical protein